MKKATKTNQPVKAEAQSEMHNTQNSGKKLHLYHKPFDPTHGRVNKTPFGINHEPGCF
ncbi:MAG TPA: hypothetical protein VHA56_17990 [Mucilaginibacter sp.]|nr:hypothetical protein [Mucilaginibacter sp.]